MSSLTYFDDFLIPIVQELHHLQHIANSGAISRLLFTHVIIQDYRD